jgi:RNA polymerase sigma factor (sigma-70 family)
VATAARGAAQAGRIAPVSQEDLEDLASTKSLELLSRAEAGAWDPGPHPPHEVAGFIRRVARNGLVDLARRRQRECPPPEHEEGWDMHITTNGDAGHAPEEWASAREFARALGDCVRALAPRARQVWYLRACLERPSRDIAALAAIQPAHVDVLVMRARAQLTACMQGKGHAAADVRPGVFAALWAEAQAWPAPGREDA